MLSEVELTQTIRVKVVELARELGAATTKISDDDMLLSLGILDSAAVLELLVWLETVLEIELAQDELSLDNFGSIALMVAFLSRRHGG